MCPTSVDIWAVGIAVVIGGQYFSWNEGLAAGSVSYGIAVGAMGMAYLCLTLSMAEMTSMMPFAGGAYGLGRCTLGFFTGFLLGCCETLEYILYVTCSCLTLSRMLATKWPELEKCKYLVWAMSYVVACLALARGGRTYWMWNRAMAAISLGIVVIFCLGSLPFVDTTLPFQSDYFVVGDLTDFLEAFPKAAWFFIGIESLNTLSNAVPNPKSTIPRGQLASMVTLLITATWTYVVCMLLPPGLPTLSAELSPLNRGFTRMFNISNATATLLAVPATFATAQGFMLSYSNILMAMANSKLLPAFLATRHASFGTPVNAMVSGTMVSFALCFVVDAWSLDQYVFNACMLFAFTSYTAQCLGYIFLKTHHKTTKRLFTSPLGIGGAVFAMCVWVLNTIGIVAFQGDHQMSLIFVVLLVGVCSGYYHGYAKHHQSFSEEEQKIMLFAHIAIHNSAKAKQAKRSKGSLSSRGSTRKMSKRYLQVGVRPSSSVAVTNTTAIES
ncbi:hypothetical protein DYB37_002017 [Aphanomyces astaci]|uniref:Amino acid permease/ SLC12A domain-containing protein n=1 Tax=Aphanomyces astaci TaxID=112090 RepID=A0A397D823_APHAT|nr:hypothetical protein DYB36_003439 [Aphanomyces astaci]RHY56912.1 hypothetical protein DYB38_000224 [Aphanomyces astaci]RHY81314.1 hypothetical protein DYB35_001264 [Aphanomyces astaci]RHZ23592.1 hypothetical protein DYB37_002017 [Aphanomyces astaci]